MMMVAFFFGPLLSALVACTPAPDKVVDNQVLEVACGTCQYHRLDGVGCYWAVALQGEYYPVAGTLPKDHDNHGPDGMCNMKRQARISGELRGENFVASGFELLPPEDVPEQPKFTPEDEHGKDYRAAP